MKTETMLRRGKRIITALLIITGMQAGEAKAENLELNDIVNGTYRAKDISGITPMLDGETYSRLSDDKQRIVTYSFKTGEETGVLFDVNNVKGKIRIEAIDGYIMSPTESHILICTETKRIYRHSFTAVYYIYNVKNRTLERLSDGGPQEVPTWSPDGNMVAFVREGNLFLVKLLFNNSESQITKDGEFNKVLNGKPDWVNEEEFSLSRAYDFTADASMLVWVRYDESEVPLYSFPWFKGLAPEREEYAEYPGAYEYKYPIAGARNSTVCVQTFDIKSRVIRQLQLPLEPDGYVPRIYATAEPEKVLVLTQNRHQNRLDIYLANPRSTECRCIVREETERYIPDKVYEQFQLVEGGFVLMSERSGFAHLYLYDLNGTQKRQLTSGEWPVTAFYGYDAKTSTTYYASAQESPLRRAVYKSDQKGRVTKLSTQEGTNSALFSKNLKYFLNVYSSLNTPPVYSLCDATGKTLKTLEDNQELRTKLSTKNLGERRFFTFKTQDGIELNGFMVLPADFSEAKKYPVVMHQYSGPGSQQVLDSWSAGNMGGCLYEQYLCQQGFICVCVDGRGTGGRGRDFEQQTYLHLGNLEAHDQAETAIYLASLPYVDGRRIGIWGWSYGGFNTLMSMSEGRGVFAAGVAVAPPTSWRYYDSIYTERFMRTPKENKEGYDDSPIGRAAQLKGRLLICHGTADDNVHYRNTMEYAEALVQADKDFSTLAYTNRNHSIYGGNTRRHLFRQITQWFVQNLQN